MTAGELDAIASRYERAWGVNRLPLLVSEQSAAKWQTALDLLAAEYPPAGFTWEQVRQSLARGWAALEAEAKARGHEPLPGPVAEAEWMPGRLFAIAHDDAHRQAMELRNKADKRTVGIFTVAEVARLIAHIPIVGEIKEAWPLADLQPPRRPVPGRMPEDAIPFGQPMEAADA